LKPRVWDKFGPGEGLHPQPSAAINGSPRRGRHSHFRSGA